MPDDQAKEKTDTLRSLGARVAHCKNVSIADPSHYCRAAENAADDPALEGERQRDRGTRQQSAPVCILFNAGRGFFANQFENTANFLAHFSGTGEEILRQTNGKVDAFVSAAGTGGTIGGVGARLKGTAVCCLLRRC